MDYERIQKRSQGGGGGISPSRLRLMLLGLEKKRKEEEELEAQRYLRSEVPEVEDRCVGTSDVCKDVGMVCSVPECSTLRTEVASSQVPATDLAFANAKIPVAQEDVPFDADAASPLVFEFQRADRAQQHFSTVVPPFYKPAPSKWDDAQKWIGSPTSNRSSKPSVGQPKRISGGIVGYGNRQGTTKVLEITEEVDTKRVDHYPSKKEATGQVNWVPDQYVVADQCAKPILYLENSVPDSAVNLSRHDPSTLFNVSTAFVTPPSTVRSVSMRDMGTEMTPVASQDPSRTGTPVRATTPTRSPTPSRPSSPGRVAPSSSPICSADLQEDCSTRVLSEKEQQMKTRREIMVLGTKLGKPNIAAWASKEEDKTTPVSHETIPVGQSAQSVIEIRAAAWEEAEKAKYLARFKREEIKIQAWENHQYAKTEAEMRKTEVKMERMRARAHESLVNKLAAARHKAEVKRATAEARRNEQAVRTEQQAEYIRRTGRIPSSFSCWSWCR